MEKKLEKLYLTDYNLLTVQESSQALSEGIHKNKCTNHNKFCLEYTNFKDGLVEFKCLVAIKITKKSWTKT